MTFFENETTRYISNYINNKIDGEDFGKYFCGLNNTELNNLKNKLKIQSQIEIGNLSGDFADFYDTSNIGDDLCFSLYDGLSGNTNEYYEEDETRVARTIVGNAVNRYNKNVAQLYRKDIYDTLKELEEEKDIVEEKAALQIESLTKSNTVASYEYDKDCETDDPTPTGASPTDLAELDCIRIKKSAADINADNQIAKSAPVIRAATTEQHTSITEGLIKNFATNLFEKSHTQGTSSVSVSRLIANQRLQTNINNQNLVADLFLKNYDISYLEALRKQKLLEDTYFFLDHLKEFRDTRGYSTTSCYSRLPVIRIGETQRDDISKSLSMGIIIYEEIGEDNSDNEMLSDYLPILTGSIKDNIINKTTERYRRQYSRSCGYTHGTKHAWGIYPPSAADIGDKALSQKQNLKSVEEKLNNYVTLYKDTSFAYVGIQGKLSELIKGSYESHNSTPSVKNQRKNLINIDNVRKLQIASKIKSEPIAIEEIIFERVAENKAPAYISSEALKNNSQIESFIEDMKCEIGQNVSVDNTEFETLIIRETSDGRIREKTYYPTTCTFDKIKKSYSDFRASEPKVPTVSSVAHLVTLVHSLGKASIVHIPSSLGGVASTFNSRGESSDHFVRANNFDYITEYTSHFIDLNSEDIEFNSFSAKGITPTKAGTYYSEEFRDNRITDYLNTFYFELNEKLRE